MLEFIFRKFPLLRVYYKGFLRLISKFTKKGEGIKVMNENWDNLIILDACRYDYFKRISWLNGELKKKASLGSHTEEWMEKNFGNDYQDTIYISGNPYISDTKCNKKFGKVPFYKIENVWDYGWEEETNWLPPESVTKAALNAHEEHPDKRLIIHYLQPHWPFPPSSKISQEYLESKKRKSLERGLLLKISEILAKKSPDMKKALEKRKEAEGGNVWDYLREGTVSVKEAKSSYEENIRLALKEVEKALNGLDGKTVVTSDHANLFGEYRIYGHPKGIKKKELIEVPWLILEKN